MRSSQLCAGSEQGGGAFSPVFCVLDGGRTRPYTSSVWGVVFSRFFSFCAMRLGFADRKSVV